MFLTAHWPISFDRPEWLWLLLLIPVIIAISVRSLRGLDRSRRIVAVVLRCLVVALLAIALARIESVKRNDHLAVMFVLDRSRSIPEDLREAAQSYVRHVSKQADRDDRFGIIGFDGKAEIDVISNRGGLDVSNFGIAVEPDRTDIAAGLRMAMASFPQGYARRAVILTDGNENMSDLRDEIEVAAANRIAVDVVPLQYTHDREILFDRIVVPTHASRDTKIPLRFIAKSRTATRAKLSLRHNGVDIPLGDPIVQLTSGMRPNQFTIPMELNAGGVHHFEAQLSPLNADDDAIPENNRVSSFTFAGGEGRVLIVTNSVGTDDQVLRDALKREKIDVEMRSIDQLNIDLLKLQEYSAVILANIPSDAFTRQQHEALASYVRDFGGGLVMTGGDEGFGAGGWMGTPVEEVSPVSFSIPSRSYLPSAALVIILDRSGSMGCPVKGSPRCQQELANEAAVLALKSVLPQDHIGVVAFDSQADWVVSLQRNHSPQRVSKMIRKIGPGGGTVIYPALELAYKALVSLGSSAAVKHVILLTDGQSHDGPYDQLMANMRRNRITLSTIGVGDGVNDQLLHRLANGTDGRYYPVRNPNMLPRVFFRETKVLRTRLISDQQFTPQVVHGFSTVVAGLIDTELPPLGGFVRTVPKADAVIPVVHRGKEGNDPVFAHWNYEMGKMAVFTSGWWPKWGGDWAAWKKFGKFWAQVIRWVMRQEASADFDVLTRLEGNTGHVVLEALNKDASYLNFLRIVGRMLTPSMQQEKLYLTQTGPGRYEATFDVKDHGNYLINLQYSTPGSESGMIRTGLSLPYSPEFREMNTNFALLDQVVDRTGGRMLQMDPKLDKVFSRDLPPAIARQPVWRWVVTWLLLPLFLLDVAGRRLASTLAMSIYVEVAVLVVACAALYAARAPLWVYGSAVILAETVGWAIRYRYILPTIKFFTYGVPALARVGQRSSASLSQLKGVRDKVRGDLKQEEPVTPSKETIALEPLADRSVRFDVGDERAVRPTGELTESLGSAAAGIETAAKEPEIKRKPTETKKPDTGDMTSRLLKAKRRARDELKGRGEE